MRSEPLRLRRLPSAARSAVPDPPRAPAPRRSVARRSAEVPRCRRVPGPPSLYRAPAGPCGAPWSVCIAVSIYCPSCGHIHDDVHTALSTRLLAPSHATPSTELHASVFCIHRIALFLTEYSRRAEAGLAQVAHKVADLEVGVLVVLSDCVLAVCGKVLHRGHQLLARVGL